MTALPELVHEPAPKSPGRMGGGGVVRGALPRGWNWKASKTELLEMN